MSVEIAIWRIKANGPKKLEFSGLGLEHQLEDVVVQDPSIVGLEVLVVGRQVPTSHGGFIDLLGVDAEGRVHVLELKRNRTPRDVVAQTLDYGSWAKNLLLDDVTRIYAEQNGGQSFDEAFALRFNHPIPDVFNPEEQLTIVAAELDSASDRIVAYLGERFAVPINVVFFRHFLDEDRQYLARSWLLSPEDATSGTKRSISSSKVRPWNGQDFYVVLGNLEQGSERWDIARNYGVLSAGGGSWYWKPLRNLSQDKRVFAYVGGAGYVGVGLVSGDAMPARDAKISVDGHDQDLLDLPLIPQAFRERALSLDPEVTEYVVPVRWLKQRDVTEAVAKQGLFASQVTACKLRDERTIETLVTAFELSSQD